MDLSSFHLPDKTTYKTNKFYLLAEQVSLLTGEPATRYLRLVKYHEQAVIRALANLKELSPRNPAAYFLWLVKRYK